MIARHVHDWAPVPGERAFYQCGCGAVGCRQAVIRVVPNLPDSARERLITARPIGDYFTGRVKAHIENDEEDAVL